MGNEVELVQSGEAKTEQVRGKKWASKKVYFGSTLACTNGLGSMAGPTGAGAD